MTSPTNQHELTVIARMNVIYHEGLERLYESLIQWTGFASVLFSSAAFAAVGDLLPAKDIVITVSAFLVTVLNAAVLAFGTWQKYIVHADLKRKWLTLLAQVETLNPDDREGFSAALAHFHQLNLAEPAANSHRLAKAQDAAEKAMGLTEKVV